MVRVNEALTSVVPRKHKTRGLCASCYGIVRKQGCLENYPRLLRRAEDVVEDATELKNLGCSSEEIARRLGMQWNSITLAFRRVQRRGAAA